MYCVGRLLEMMCVLCGQAAGDDVLCSVCGQAAGGKGAAV